MVTRCHLGFKPQVSMSKVCSDGVKLACGVGRAIGEPDLHKWNHGCVSVISHGYMCVCIYIYICMYMHMHP